MAGSSNSGASPGPWVPPTAEELQKLLPEYEISAQLGRGGMGAVYKGRQISLDRPVAIKILSGALEDADASFAERFKNEARAMGQLNHPGIVAVHDFGEAEGGLLYIVMEFIEGTDVSRMLAKEGRLPPEHALAITAHVCDALQFAHDRGIIHRDIKPANIMVGYDGVVKVADFGLAKMTNSQNTGLTQSGMAMGTLHYMAPEALMLGNSVDHRADIYAVGVMLYQMLTGKLPQGMFDPPSQQIPGLDPRYDDVVKQAIRDDREVRYQNVLELRMALDAILTQPVARVEASEAGEKEPPPAALPTQARPHRTSPQTAPQPPRGRTSVQKSTGGLSSLLWVGFGLLVLAGVLIVLFTRSETEKTTTPAKVAATAFKNTLSGPSSLPPWPTGPHFQSAGRFRAWSSNPNDKAIELSKLKEVNDAVQVHALHGGWVVLRASGQTISSDGKANLANIESIQPGFLDWFCLIERDGTLHLFNKAGEIDDVPSDLPAVKDAFAAPFLRIALCRDGTVRLWGKVFDGVTGLPGNPEWGFQPQFPEDKKVVSISSSDHAFALLFEDGELRLFNHAGEIPVPTELGPGTIKQFALNRSRLFVVPQGGQRALTWQFNEGSRTVGAFLPSQSVEKFLESNGGIFSVDNSGAFAADQSLTKAVAGLDDVLKLARVQEPLHASLSVQFAEPCNTYLIWYDATADTEPRVIASKGTEPSGGMPAPNSAKPDGSFKPITPTKVPFKGQDYFAWSGSRVRIMSPSEDFSPDIMGEVLHYLDLVIDRFEELSGMELAYQYQIRGLAEYKGGIGWANSGVNMSANRLRGILGDFAKGSSFRDYGIMDLACSHFINTRLGPPFVNAEASRNIVSGVMMAVFVLTFGEAGIPMQSGLEDWKSQFAAAVTEYSASPPGSVPEWFSVGDRGDIKRKYITAGVLLRLCEQHGGIAFLERWFQNEIPKLQKAKTGQQAADNFYVSLCGAARTDLREFLITQMRLSVSEAAIAEVAKRLPSVSN
ncbi:MAG: serine/threonine-protein kinase [Prosthecobacter sp.]